MQVDANGADVSTAVLSSKAKAESGTPERLGGGWAWHKKLRKGHASGAHITVLMDRLKQQLLGEVASIC